MLSPRLCYAAPYTLNVGKVLFSRFTLDKGNNFVALLIKAPKRGIPYSEV